MKKLLLGSCIIILFFSSCSKDAIWGEGPLVTETRSIDNFTGISSAIPGHTRFTIGPVYNLGITAQQNILDAMRTSVVNGVLEIGFRNGVSVRTHEDIEVNITAPSANYLNLSGSGDMDVIGDMVTSNLIMNVSGAGNINLAKASVTNKIDAQISGSGNINVSAGSAQNEDLRISGSGGMNLANVPVGSSDLHISGSGNMKVNVTQSLHASISGSGSVLYKGSPSISTSISGSGTVRPL